MSTQQSRRKRRVAMYLSMLKTLGIEQACVIRSPGCTSKPAHWSPRLAALACESCDVVGWFPRKWDVFWEAYRQHPAPDNGEPPPWCKR